jgi:exopolysaccharide biosynthesis polyprenyl glycosylphosphotransferase
MKKSQLFLSVVMLPLDFLVIILAGLSAYALRFNLDYLPVVFQVPWDKYLPSVLVTATVWIVLFLFSGLYAFDQSRKLRQQLKRVLIGCSLGFVVITIYIFFIREVFSSRFIILSAWLLAILYMSILRLIMSLIRQALYKQGIAVSRIVMIGDSKTTEVLIREFASNKALGYQVVKRFAGFGNDEAEQLEKLLITNDINEVIQSDPNLSKAEVLRLYDFADEHHLTFRYAADLLDAKVLRVEVTELAGVPMVEVKKTSLDGWGRVVKRIFDICISACLIVLTSPLMIAAALMIKLDSRGPVFFAKLDDGSPLYRVGQAGKLFRYFKFRTMRPGTDSLRYSELAKFNLRSDSPLTKIKDDPRVTRVGKFMRRFSIDELSEFFLVFIGSMSLVGPRPHLPEEVAKYQIHHKKVLTIKPGITGLAQVSGRSDLSFEDETRLDAYYIENWSLWLDLIILLRTPMAIFKTRKAE